MSYKGKYKPRNPRKYRGDPNRVIYRSLWERKFMVYCDESDAILEWGSEEIIIPYLSPWDGKMHRYYPDFYLKVKQASGKRVRMIIEIKPKKQCKPPPENPKRKTKKWLTEVKNWGVNSAKWKYATKFCENNGMEFRVLTEDHLNISYK